METMDHSHHDDEGTPLEYLKFAGVILFIGLFSFFYSRSEEVTYLQAFMGVFFVVFAGFKLLDLKGFVNSYIGYDLIAQRSMGYAYAYPFIELAIGIGYMLGTPTWLHWFTLLITGIGGLGVAKQLLRKSKIKCACLGTYIKLPLTTVSLTEDLLMAVMALIMIIK